jgi:hypothetical protein
LLDSIAVLQQIQMALWWSSHCRMLLLLHWGMHSASELILILGGNWGGLWRRAERSVRVDSRHQLMLLLLTCFVATAVGISMVNQWGRLGRIELTSLTLVLDI